MNKGLTLVELLVVVVVMTILLAIGLPAMRTAIQDRKLRVAAEMVREQFRAAQSLAAQYNSPSGVVLICDLPSDKPQGEKTPACLTVGVLQPQTIRYAGDVAGSQALVTLSGPTGLQVTIDDAGAGQAVHVGDQIRFENLWDRCRVASVPASGPPWVFSLEKPAAPPPCPSPPTSVVPYQHQWCSFVVLVRPTAVAAKVEMPRGVCVDLSASGFGDRDTSFRHLDPAIPSPPTPSPVKTTVYFDVLPNGSIGSIRFTDGAPEPVVAETIHLLIGEVDRVGLTVSRPIPPMPPLLGDPTNTVPDNVTNPSGMWIRVKPRTGSIALVPNYWTDATYTVADARSLED